MAARAAARKGGEARSYLVRGEDAALVAQAARALIERLVDGRDAALVVEEHGGSSSDDVEVAAVVDACTTPPFLTDRRVVVVREAGRLSAADATRLLAVVTDPLPTSFLVLVAGSGTVPQALSKAVAAQGEVVECSMRTTGDRKGWLADRLHEAPVRFDTPAANLLRTHLGDDLGRLESVLGTLVAAYGPGASIDRHRLEPFLGLAGSVPPWELTGAIDEGDTAAALDALARMTGGGGMAGPAVVGVLHRHFANMLRLSGADVRNDDEAAALLGMRPGYPAKKALAQSRRLGGEPLAQAILLLAEADLQVKGRTALPTSLVLEVLVARLSRLVRGGAPARASARRR